MGRLTESRVCFIHKGEIDIPSDLYGIGRLSFTQNIKECFTDLEKELKEAKYL